MSTYCTFWLTARASLAFILATLGASPIFAEHRFLLVAHKDVPVDAIPRQDAARTFLKGSARWSDGTPVRPVILAHRETHEAFASVVLGKTETELKRYWQRQIFTGHGSPPPERSTEEEVVEFVSRTPGAIGYVSADAKSEGVKMLELL